MSGATERLSNGAAAKALAPAQGSSNGTTARGTARKSAAAGSAGSGSSANANAAGVAGGAGNAALSERPVAGTLSVTSPDGSVLAVDADAYVAELKGEVGKLRGELLAMMARRDQRDAAQASDLIAYVNALPKSDMQTLTSGVAPDVLEAMEALVYGILKQFGVQDGERIVLESSDAMKKLLLWQLAIGYNLREMEVREDFKKQFMENEAADELYTGAIENKNQGSPAV